MTVNASLKITFLPFQVERVILPEQSMREHESIDVNQFDMADILYDPLTREFIGLSIAISSSATQIAFEFTKHCRSNQIRFISNNDASFSKGRYTNFGPRARLEVLWNNVTKDYQCEPASLWQSTWYVKSGFIDSMPPECVCLVLDFVDDIADTHSLNLAVIL
jgi:hypothetical protein